MFPPPWPAGCSPTHVRLRNSQKTSLDSSGSRLRKCASPFRKNSISARSVVFIRLISGRVIEVRLAAGASEVLSAAAWAFIAWLINTVVSLGSRSAPALHAGLEFNARIMVRITVVMSRMVDLGGCVNSDSDIRHRTGLGISRQSMNSAESV